MGVVLAYAMAIASVISGFIAGLMFGATFVFEQYDIAKKSEQTWKEFLTRIYPYTLLTVVALIVQAVTEYFVVYLIEGHTLSIPLGTVCRAVPIISIALFGGCFGLSGLLRFGVTIGTDKMNLRGCLQGISLIFIYLVMMGITTATVLGGKG